MKISNIKPNPNNPRLVKDTKFEKLCNSIKEFPKMMELRPIVIDNDSVILGGNMRYKALLHLGFKEIPDSWVKSADSLTEEEKKRFIISDNVGFGEFDWDMIANEWNEDELEAWGLDLPVWDDYSEKNKEVNTDDFGDKMTIKLEYCEEDFHRVKEALLRIADTPEDAVYKLLKL